MGLAQANMHHLHGLAPTIVEEAVDVLAGSVPLGLAAETRTEAVQELAQSSQQRARASPVVTRGAYWMPRKSYQCVLFVDVVHHGST